MPDVLLDGTAYLFAAFYHVDGQFSHLRKFVYYFHDYLQETPFDRGSLVSTLNKIQDDLIVHGEIRSNLDAFKCLAAEDLAKVVQVLPDSGDQIEKMAPTESLLRKTCDFGVTALRELGLNTQEPDIYIVDNFPPPYDASPVSALTIEANSHAELKGGLYFLREDIRPYYSSSLLLHELIHYVVGDGNLTMARGLEEGLAEIIGSLFLANKYLGPRLTRRIFTYNRLFEADHKLWDVYLDYTRQAASLYLLIGLNGLVDVLRDGRAQIKHIERLYSLGEQPAWSSLSQWDAELTAFVHSLVLGYVPHMVVSAAAKYVSRFVRPNLSTNEIIGSARIERSLGERALAELAQSARVIAMSPNLEVVTHSDCDLVQLSLRYSVPG